MYVCKELNVNHLYNERSRMTQESFKNPFVFALASKRTQDHKHLEHKRKEILYLMEKKENNRKVVKNYMKLFDMKGKVFDISEVNPNKWKMVKQDSKGDVYKHHEVPVL